MVPFDIFYKYDKLHTEQKTVGFPPESTKGISIMKARNYLTILFAVVAIIVLIALAGFMTIYVADDSNPLRQQIMQVISPEESSENIQPASEIITEQAETAALKAHSFLFVGDSRTIGMGDAVNDNCTYIGAEGEGYDWFSSEGAELLEEALAEDPALFLILGSMIRKTLIFILIFTILSCSNTPILLFIFCL